MHKSGGIESINFEDEKKLGSKTEDFSNVNSSSNKI